MIQGTSSHCGKTLFVAGLCRLLSNRGYKVAPFKAQNIALHSYISVRGKRDNLACSQYIQALACRIEAENSMNPVLINVFADYTRFVVGGKTVHEGSFRDYKKLLPVMKEAIFSAYAQLKKNYDIVIIEGAGSPAEINFQGEDIANMWTAEFTQSPVLLVSNIEYGGAFASLAGTMELLPEKYKEYVKGYILNKFSGARETLYGGTDFLEKKYGIKFYGVLPFIKGLSIPEEDTLNTEGITLMEMREDDLDSSLDILSEEIDKSIDFFQLLTLIKS